MIKIYTTYFTAIMPETLEASKFEGIRIAARSWELAEQWCRDNAPYLSIEGEFVMEFSADKRHKLDMCEEPKESKQKESKPSK